MAAALDNPDPSRPRDPAEATFNTLVLAAIALAAVALYLAYATGYGYFRDEFYYLACANHLSFGYVDHPPLSIWLLYLQRSLFGDSLFALRLLPAVYAGVLAFVTGRLARELGADLYGQILAAVATVLTPVFMVTMGFYSMNAFDPIIWTLGALVIVRIIRSGNPRLWLLFGLIAGVGLENKHLMLFFGFGVAVGLLLTRERRQLASIWFWAGGALTLALFMPNLVWQIRHGWPTLEFMQNAERFKDYHPPPPVFVLGQIATAGPLAAPLWLSGLWFYLFSRKGRDLRVLGWTYRAILAVFSWEGAKDYYLAPAYPMLLATGAAAFENWFSGARLRWLRPAYLGVLVASAVAISPLVMPILPPQKLVAYLHWVPLASVPTERGKNKVAMLPQHFADRFSWPEKVRAIASVYDSLSIDDRAHTAILADNYGEAGAIDFFGPRLGLPHAVSTHNTYWIWGPPPDDTRVMITIGISRKNLEQYFDTVTEAAVITCLYCMPYEDHLAIYVCRGPKENPSQVWPRGKRFI